MKKIFLSIVVAALAISAFAQGSKKAPPAPPKKLHCAVMTQNAVDPAKATKAKLFADFKGRRYFFCCAMCPPQFKKNPAKFAKNDSVPIPKPKATVKGTTKIG